MPMLLDPSAKYRAAQPVPLPNRRWPDAVLTQAPIWLTTDLRDGNQALIEPMDPARKRRMFEMLVKIGFKQIEVGFPAASQADFDFVRLLIDDGLIPDDVTIQVLTPARAELIERSFEAVEGAPRVIVHLYNATAPVMRQLVLGLDEDGIVELATVHAALIRRLAADRPATEWTFQYSPEMFSGTELAFSRRVVDAVTAVWQPTPERPCIINLPSTVERSTPNVFADQVEWMHRRLQRRDSIVLSVHPHNDRGTGTAAGELALMAGADRIEGCLFGNGERTGNVDLVNIALNLYTQGVAPGLDFSDIDEVRRCVEHCNQLRVSERHPYVGDLVYTSFSGSHQDAIRKAFAARRDGDDWVMPYLPIDPQDLGRTYDAVIRVNSQSGKGGIAYLLEQQHRVVLPRRLQIEFSAVVQAVMDDLGQEMTADDLWDIFCREYRIDTLALGSQQLTQTADGRLSLALTAQDGERRFELAGHGGGPLDALVDALTQATGRRVTVLDYQQHALATGADARAAAYVELRVDAGPSLYGVGIDANITTASLKALLCGALRAGLTAPMNPTLTQALIQTAA